VLTPVDKCASVKFSAVNVFLRVMCNVKKTETESHLLGFSRQQDTDDRQLLTVLLPIYGKKLLSARSGVLSLMQ
jgi:hypothetical protein